jgi:hypothetical protein
MKHLRILLTVSLVATIASFSIARADTYDSDDATIQKKSDTTANVLLDKKTYVVPISFGDGASWDSVKDHYELSDASAACVKSCKKVKLSVAADGTASWSK